LANLTSDKYLASLRAETLTGPNSQFGSRSVYEPNSRTLFVTSNFGSSTVKGTVDVYINEGLYWRKVQTIESTKTSLKFGADLAVSGNLLVIGAPNASSTGQGSAFVYQRDTNGETWSLVRERIGGTTQTPSPSFGTSVAVSGDKIVVGAPDEPV